MIRPKILFFSLLATDLLSLLLHLGVSSRLDGFFDLNREGNFPTWYSSFKFGLASVAALFCWLSEERAGVEGKLVDWGWLAVTGLMLGMSMDETGQLHERITHWVMGGNAGDKLRIYFGFSREAAEMLWVVLFAPLLVFLGAIFLGFYHARLRTFPKHFILVVLAMGLLAASAGLEILEGKISGSEAYMESGAWSRFRFYIVSEEMAELIASTLFVFVHYNVVWRKFSRN